MGDENKPSQTPKLDELEKGPWPSFVREIKRAATKSPMARDLLGVLELSYEEKVGHWKHGGIVGVRGYGGGVIGRYSDVPEKFPNVAHFHTLRVNQPAGWFYRTEALRAICDLWERHGSGLTNLHGSTGDIILLGTRTEELESTFADLTKAGFDLGGSGSDVRTPSCCVGPARCEWACYDTLNFTYDITMHFQDELHRPAFPYKFKFKASGCPNDCVAAIARADLSIIGTWRDEIQIDQAALKEYTENGIDIQADVCERCPSQCMSWNGKELRIADEWCVKCMHCINAMPKALRPGQERGAVILIGSKAPIVQGAMLSSVLVPFMKMEPPYTELKELVGKILDLWSEEGKSRERVGEFIQRVGLGNFLEAIGLEPKPEMVAHPRENPYVFYEEYFEEEPEAASETEG
ncbi:MAG: dissimilatory-type sulfite reductase subunit alpha [Candidatus Tectomicrobia bacterium]|uniref:Dissimilatory-type sulfite reductase subunit alpha n=1 Tax=Tectimicrobiota bacterium TaxID=2528274 RepID=A0A932GMI9_UNCTE|nr:dissimilatory-type sulfite reductase subunit alpha [Candidatus Tectomicrobia bacterium]